MDRSSRRHGTGAEDSGFSPLFDRIADRCGLVTAAVYGAAWRHCQMRDRVCRASSHRLARLLGTSHVTVQRHLRLLVQEGYLEDTTPGRRNKPHIFRVTNLDRPRLERGLDDAGVQD